MKAGLTTSAMVSGLIPVAALASQSGSAEAAASEGLALADQLRDEEVRARLEVVQGYVHREQGNLAGARALADWFETNVNRKTFEENYL